MSVQKSNLVVKIPTVLMKQLKHDCIENDLHIQDAVTRAIFAWLHPKGAAPGPEVEGSQEQSARGGYDLI